MLVMLIVKLLVLVLLALPLVALPPVVFPLTVASPEVAVWSLLVLINIDVELVLDSSSSSKWFLD